MKPSKDKNKTKLNEQQQQSKTQTLCPEIIPQSPGKAETVQVRAMVLCRTLQDCFISNAIKNNQLIVANLVPGAISQNLLHQTVCPVFSLPRDTLQNFGREDPPFASLQTKAGCKRGKLYGFKCVFFLFLLSSFFFFSALPSFLPSFSPPLSSFSLPLSLPPSLPSLFFFFSLLLSFFLMSWGIASLGTTWICKTASHWSLHQNFHADLRDTPRIPVWSSFCCALVHVLWLGFWQFWPLLDNLFPCCHVQCLPLTFNKPNLN